MHSEVAFAARYNEEDLYSFQDYPPPPDMFSPPPGYGEDYYEEVYQKPSASVAPTGGVRKGTAATGSRGQPSRAGGRPGGSGDEQVRPMTSVAPAGYRSELPGRPRLTTDTTAQRAAIPPIQRKKDEGPEEVAKELEKEVNTLIEESAVLRVKGNQHVALEKAKEASKRERKLTKYREQNNLSEMQNMDLTYAVAFNLAHQYHQSQMFQEALSTYQPLVKNKQFQHAGRLRVNMGNIYYQQKKYPSAIKMYRMALDQIPNTIKGLRSKILRNMGNCFVRTGQFQDAIQAFEAIMEDSPDHRSGLNLILCYYTLGDKEHMKRGIQLLISLRKPQTSDIEDVDDSIDHISDPDSAPNDPLKQELRERQKLIDHAIIMGGQLIAPLIEKDIALGYDWVIDTLRASNCSDLANELEIAKAVMYMKKKNFEKTIETLKAFEKKDQKMIGTASTNLSFLYFLERNYSNAEKYADVAIQADRYNAKALVNKGNCFAVKNDLENAKNFYLEAVKGESDCIEAIYNLGLSYKKLEQYDKALSQFTKLHTMIPHHPEVEYQIATIYEKIDDTDRAMKSMKQVLTLVQTDPGVLAKLGSLFADEDESSAFQYFLDSYRYYPVNISVISWLSIYYLKNEVYEKAIHYFQRAAQLQPNEVKWQLMVGSCQRRMGSYQQALELYRKIHTRYPDNVECLRYLVNLCNDLNLKDEMHEYMGKMRKLQKDADSPNEEDAIRYNNRPTYENPSTDLSSVSQYNSTLSNAMKKRTDDDEFDDDAGENLLPL